VDGFRAESLDGLPRNQWTTCSGMTGRIAPEYAVASFHVKDFHQVSLLSGDNDCS
jgi:hypothetical protein